MEKDLQFLCNVELFHGKIRHESSETELFYE